MIAPELVIDGEPYKLFEARPGAPKWDVERVPTQPGDGTNPIPVEMRWEGGFGASKRYTDGNGRQTAPRHAEYRQNWDSRFEGINCASPRITYLSLSSLAEDAAGFRLGGGAFGRLGGGFSGALGGGSTAFTPAAIQQFGNYLYVSAGQRTFTVDPAASTPSVEEVRDHGASARVRSSDVFDNELVVACGATSDAEGATAPRATSTPTQWEQFAGVRMSAYATGKAGRLFSARNNLVFNVLAGQDPSVLANYLPSTGEVLTDETEPIRAIEEFSRALVGTTAQEARTFDPDAGFFSRALIPKGRISPSEWDGFGLITVGNMMLVAFARAVWLFRGGQPPVLSGPELLDQNESPYIGGQPGIPDMSGHGDYIYWPYYFPDTGDSVIFAVRPRNPGEPGVGPLVWQDVLYLSGRECRVVRYWGGTSSVKPRLFFGAGTTADPQQIGWVDLGRGGGPDVFNTDASPATSAVLYTADDDLGYPTTIKEIDRIELPEVTNADEGDYLVVSVSSDGGTDYDDFVTEQGAGPDAARVRQTGMVTLYPPEHHEYSGVKLKTRWTITQASASTAFLTIRGFPQMYVSLRPLTTDLVTTLIDVEPQGHETADDVVKRLTGFGGQRVEVEGGPGQRTRWFKIVRVRQTQAERHTSDFTEFRSVVELVMREVAVQ